MQGQMIAFRAAMTHTGDVKKFAADHCIVACRAFARFQGFGAQKSK